MSAARRHADPLDLPGAPVARETSNSPLVSPRTRLLADKSKATKRPVAESAGRRFTPLVGVPPRPMLTCSVRPVRRLRMKMSSKRAVGGARYEIAGLRVEGDDAAVGRDRQATGGAVVVGLGTARGDACPLGLAVQPIVDEHIGAVVGIVRHPGAEGIGDEGHEPAARRDRDRTKADVTT
ncbi:MAG: hypothetical protein U1E17_08030 [Geminicoccaceae bacterium]